MTPDGDGAIAFTIMGEDHFPTAGYARIDERGNVGPLQIAAAGLGADDGFTSYKAFVGDPPRTRWGDYGAAVTDGDDIWLASEYIAVVHAQQWLTGAIGSCGGTRTALANWATRLRSWRSKLERTTQHGRARSGPGHRGTGRRDGCTSRGSRVATGCAVDMPSFRGPCRWDDRDCPNSYATSTLCSTPSSRTTHITRRPRMADPVPPRRTRARCTSYAHAVRHALGRPRDDVRSRSSGASSGGTIITGAPDWHPTSISGPGCWAARCTRRQPTAPRHDAGIPTCLSYRAPDTFRSPGAERAWTTEGDAGPASRSRPGRPAA